MMCQYMELNIPMCHPNMYPFLKLETNIMIMGDGKIGEVKTTDEFLTMWVNWKLETLAPFVELEQTEKQNKEYLYKFLLSITDSAHFVWFVWAPQDERDAWVAANISENAIDVINNMKMGDIPKLAEAVLRHEGRKEIEIGYVVYKISDYYIKKLRQ
jgi:hypothetical protein